MATDVPCGGNGPSINWAVPYPLASLRTMNAGMGVPCCHDAVATAATIGSGSEGRATYCADAGLCQQWQQRMAEQVRALRVQTDQASVEIVGALAARRKGEIAVADGAAIFKDPGLHQSLGSTIANGSRRSEKTDACIDN